MKNTGINKFLLTAIAVLIILIGIIMFFIAQTFLPSHHNDGENQHNSSSQKQSSSHSDNKKLPDGNEEEPAEEEKHPAISADHIKQLDLWNNLAPYAEASANNENPCPNFPYGRRGTPPTLEPMPDEENECWLQLSNGQSNKLYEGPGAGGRGRPGVPLVDWTTGGSEGFTTKYQDIDGDGYLDAVMKGGAGGGVAEWIYIFNPADPAHPDAAGFFMGSDGGMLEFDNSGSVTEYDSPSTASDAFTYHIVRTESGRAQLQ